MRGDVTGNEKGLLGNMEPGANFREKVSDALELLNFAVSEGREVEDRIILALTSAERFVISPDQPSVEDRAAFEKAYRDLARFLAPVTIKTLRETSDKHGRKLWRLLVFRQTSEAKIWSRKLWYLTVLFILIALFGENLHRILTEFFPADEETRGTLLRLQIVSSVIQSMIPFTYGAIGSLTFLLRSCHQFIRNREFDQNRVPEYISRILLGIVSGGTISLFIQEMGTEQGTIKISAAALGFLAGYNTDFLFKTIERIAEAILPKVGLQTIQRGRGVAAGAPLQRLAAPVSIETLIELREKATNDETKKFLEELIGKSLQR